MEDEEKIGVVMMKISRKNCASKLKRGVEGEWDKKKTN